MLKPLLLLCWTAIFVSAGDQKINDINGTSVPTGLSQDRISAQSQLSLDNAKSAILNNERVPPIQIVPLSNSSKLSDLNPDIKSKMSTSSALDEGKHDAITESIIAPTIKDTSTTVPSTTNLNTTHATASVPIITTVTTTITPTTTITTTPAPTTPVPPPDTKKWVVEQNNTKCIIVQMAAQFNFSYTVKNKTIQKMMDIPGHGNGTVSGTCGDVEQNLTISWDVQKDMDSFTLHFMKNVTTKRYSLHHFEIFLVREEFPSDWNNTVTLVHMAPQYDTGLSNSYRCLREQKLNLYIPGVNETVGHLTISQLQFQAFRSDNKTIFGLAKDCAFDTPDIVPITVGCALAGLVVIVLIAYLVGRRRSQARGYLSM